MMIRKTVSRELGQDFAHVRSLEFGGERARHCGVFFVQFTPLEIHAFANVLSDYAIYVQFSLRAHPISFLLL